MHAKLTEPKRKSAAGDVSLCVAKLLLQGQLKLMEEVFRFSLLNNWKIKSCYEMLVIAIKKRGLVVGG